MRLGGGELVESLGGGQDPIRVMSVTLHLRAGQVFFIRGYR
jgi:hypothetical protein